MDDEIHAIICLFGLVVVLPFAIRAWLKVRRLEPAMEEAARRRKAEMIRGSGFRVVADGIELIVGVEVEKLSSDLVWTAILPHRLAADFEVRPYLAAAPPHVPLDDLAAVEVAFRRRFSVTTEDPDTFRRIWGPEESRTMWRSFPEGGLEGKGWTIRLRARIEPDADLIEAGVDLALRIARADGCGLLALRSLADAREAPLSPDGFPAVVIEEPIRIWIGAELYKGRASTRARAGVARTRAPFVTDVVDGEPVDRAAMQLLPHEARGHVRDLGTAHVEWIESAASIRWPSIEANRRRLEGAVEFLRALARPPSAGVFR
jgi:hypothetical protein